MDLIFGKYGRFGRKINAKQCPRWSRGRGGIRLSAGGKKEKPLSLYKGVEYQASSLRPFEAYLRSRSHTNGHGWVTHVCIDENPMIRATRSLL